MSKGWKRQLTQEAEDEREDFNKELGDGGCTCFISPPCSWCLHPGNPHNQEGDDSAWEWISPGQMKQIARMAKPLTRRQRKEVKLRLRGTYRRKDRWRVEAAFKRMMSARKTFLLRLLVDTTSCK